MSVKYGCHNYEVVCSCHRILIYLIWLQLESELERKSSSADAMTRSRTSADGGTPESEQVILLDLRRKIAELEVTCEKLQEEKAVLECRIEQRHLQVSAA